MILDRRLCLLFGHNWELLPSAIPEDRDTYRCERCDEWRFNPARVGETEVAG